MHPVRSLGHLEDPCLADFLETVDSLGSKVPDLVELLMRSKEDLDLCWLDLLG